MNFRIVLVLVVVGFVVFCGGLVAKSGLDSRLRGNDKGAAGQSCILLAQRAVDEKSGTANAPAREVPQIGADDSVTFGADNAPAKSVTLGSVDPKSGFKFQLELSSKGAAIRKATFSGFDDRDYKDPQPLVILSPVRQADGSEILSMANKGFQTDALVQQKLQVPLDKFNWKSFDKEVADDGSQTARFEAFFKVEDTNDTVFKLIKTYTIIPGSYLLECNLTVENLSVSEQKVRFNLTGPLGLGREGIRGDMRKAVAGFRDSQGKITSVRRDAKKLRKAKTIDGRRLVKSDANFLWVAAVNKYFAAILVPIPEEGEDYCDWVTDKTGRYYNPDGRADTGDETVGVDLKIASSTLAPTGQANSAKTYNFQLYLGPKDKSLFDKKKLLLFSIGLQFQSDLDNGIISEPLQREFKNNRISLSRDTSVSIEEKGKRWLITDNKEIYKEIYIVRKQETKLNIYRKLYRELGFVQTIDFLTCCCPTSIISPLAFGILWIMRWMYGFIANYGVVIIVLVLLFRMAMHPITKKSQVSMSKFSKLAPKAAEIKKKYANNKAEMNKQMMALYREQGASPIMGFLPMMVQMPVWIALYSAIYASIELRGAAFLPFWITDLSVPDALFRFAAITIPLLKWKIDSFNLLPILMGLAFYLQQKLMPKQAAASANPQVAQQQKMMMIMLPLLFPLMLYTAPSGLNLYIMASTFAGAIEQYVIRKHLREKEQAESKGLVAATSKTGAKVKKKKPKPFYKI